MTSFSICTIYIFRPTGRACWDNTSQNTRTAGCVPERLDGYEANFELKLQLVRNFSIGP